MDLITLVIGIAIGAVFSPFWMMVWKALWGWVSSHWPPSSGGTPTPPAPPSPPAA